jgi:hypothetical protein
MGRLGQRFGEGRIRYLGFANKPIALDPVLGPAFLGQLVVNVEHSIQVVKGGLNWRFGPTASTVPARY